MVHSDFPFSYFIFWPLLKVECKCQHSCVSSHFHEIRCHEIDGITNFSSLTSFSSNGPRMWGIWSMFMYFVFLWDALCCMDPCLMFDVGSCFLTCSMIPAWCDVNHLWCVLVAMIHHVLFEIPLLLCWWDTHVSPCMFALRSLLCHVGGMLIIITRDIRSYR